MARPRVVRERFIDILLAFEANPHKRLDRARTVVLRPKPTGGYRAIGITVSPM